MMNKKPATREELVTLTLTWLPAWVPSETTIDGGIFPSRIADGLFARGYDEFLSNVQSAEVPEFEELPGDDPIQPTRRLRA